MTRSKKLGLLMPTAAEDAGIAADSDTVEITSADVARMQCVALATPKLAATQVPVTIRLDADLLGKVKCTGDRWQTG